MSAHLTFQEALSLRSQRTAASTGYAAALDHRVQGRQWAGVGGSVRTRLSCGGHCQWSEQWIGRKVTFIDNRYRRKVAILSFQGG